MITEKNNVFYCDCGFSFQRNRSGAHDCADGLRNKLAESEARCAALAAENAELKDAISSVFPDGVEDEPGKIGFTATAKKAFYTLNETPATDAFLAEVRAQGVEMLRDSIAEIEVGIEDTIDLHHYCSDFAAEVRKGVQS